MSESYLERLSKFTPDAGRLERDALLFAAGRASARPNRAWIALASALAGTQVLSLALLWPALSFQKEANSLAQTEPSSGGPMPTVGESALSDSSLWTACHRWMEMDSENQPVSEGAFIESGPPLRAFISASVDPELTR